MVKAIEVMRKMHCELNIMLDREEERATLRGTEKESARGQTPELFDDETGEKVFG